MALAATRASAASPQLLTTAQPPGSELAAVVVDNNEVEIDFPSRLTFSLDLRQAEAVTGVVLEYGTEQLTCGAVVAKSFPAFEPGATTSVSWTWEMAQSGSQPPGAQVWWRWHLLDDAGVARVTERQTATWLDDRHDWETLSQGGVSLHWYSGSQAFAETLHSAALTALDDLAVTPGLGFDGEVNLYIYGDSEALQEAVLYEPGWTGGLAYAEHSIVLIGVSPDQLDWGTDTVAHELTHVLVGHYTFSCLGFVPTWLNEGLAVYGEGGPSETWTAQLERAIEADTLVPLASLNGSFSEDPAQADLSYVQSYSLVNYLMETYGGPPMLDLLARLRDGVTVEAALLDVYGLGLSEFERAWRAAIGARPLPQAQATTTPQPTATVVPTTVPLAGVPAGPTVAPTRERPLPTPVPRARAPFGRPEAGLVSGGVLLILCLALVCPSVLFVGLGGATLWRLRRRP